jgi:DNA repair protein RadA/Sms
LKEAEKLGFRQAEVPSGSGELWKDRSFRLMETAALPDLVARIAAAGAGKKLKSGM